MASTSAPSVAGSRAVTDVQYEQMARTWGPDGILGTPSDAALVYGDSTGRQVKIRANRHAIVGGHGYFSGGVDIVVPVTANTSGSTRIDQVVLRLDRSTWAVTEVVKAGTPGAGVPPTPTLNSYIAGTGVWEMPLANVAVANGASTTNSGDVTPIAPYIPPGALLYVADLPTLNSLPTPSPDQLAWVASDKALYSYVAGAWRRSDWNASWGVVGGRTWAPSGVFFAAGITGTELPVYDSGAVSCTAGRRYALAALVRVIRTGSTGDVDLRIRDTNLSGTVRGYLHTQNFDINEGYDLLVRGRYTCTANESKTWMLTAKTNDGTTVDFLRSPAQEIFFEVVDIGPSANLTAS